MAKANPKRKAPFDIFGDERLGTAMQAATAPGPDKPDPAPQAPSAKALTSESGEGQGAGSQPPSPRSSSPVPPRPAAAAPPAPPPAPRTTRAAARAALPASSIEDHVPLKFEVPRSTRAEFQAFKAELGAALGGVALDNSNIGRALLARLLGPERARVLAAAREVSGTLTRPRNDDAQAMTAFDAELLSLFGRDD